MDDIMPDEDRDRDRDEDEDSLDIAPDEEEIYEEDTLLNEGFDDSFKTQDKNLEEQDEDNEEKNDIDSDEDEEKQKEIDNSQKNESLKNPQKKRRYKIFPLLYKEEYSNLLGDIAYEISNSILTVPKEYEELFNVESGNSIEIATNWMLYYKRCPIPGKYIVITSSITIMKLR